MIDRFITFIYLYSSFAIKRSHKKKKEGEEELII